jgi:hypothetical protein
MAMAMVQLSFAQAQEKQAEYANKKRRDIEFCNGTNVTGPYHIYYINDR